MDRTSNSLGRMHLLMAAVAVAFAWMVGPFLVPVILGAVLAALVAPAQQRLARWLHLGPSSSSALATLLFTVGLLLPFVGLLVAGVRGLAALVRDVTAHASREGGLEATFLKTPAVQRAFEVLEGWTSFRREDLNTHLADLLQQVGLKAGGFLGAALGAMPQLLVFLFIMLLALYFIMVDGDRLRRWAVRQSPFPEEATTDILDGVKQTSALTLLSSVAVSGVQSVVVLVGMLLTGVPNAFMWFAVAFLSAFLPIIGTLPVSVGCIVYLAANGQMGGAIVMLVCLVVAGVSDNVVRPLIIGGGSEQHPLVLLLSIFGGLSMLGFPGLFIGPVLASLFMAVLRVYTKVLRPEVTVPPPAAPAPQA